MAEFTDEDRERIHAWVAALLAGGFTKEKLAHSPGCLGSLYDPIAETGSLLDEAIARDLEDRRRHGR